MPARKSNASAVSAAEDGSAPAPPQKEKEHGKDKDKDAHDGTSVEDLALPRTMIQRLAKGVLPPNTQIQKDALLAMSKSATVFVNYLTSQYVVPDFDVKRVKGRLPDADTVTVRMTTLSGRTRRRFNRRT